MKRTNKIIVFDGGRKVEITIRQTQKANWNKKDIEHQFDCLVDKIFICLEHDFHVKEIKLEGIQK